MSKTRDALRVPVYQPRGWGKPTKGRPLPEPFWGLDTERDAKTGEFVCGWVSNASSSLPFRGFRDLPVGTYWVWNLGYDLEGMVRDLGKEEGWAMKEDGTAFELDGAKCVYYQGKRFEWRDESGRRIFLEASSFFNRIPLKEAAKTLCICGCDGCKRNKEDESRWRHCGENETKCPMKDPVDASKMSLAKYRREKAYRETVDRYCQKDARIAFKLMDFLRLGFVDLGLKMSGAPIHIGGTPGSTARRLMRDMPAFPKVIWTTHRPFLETYCGGRFEVVKRGVFDNAIQYDKISAYPWALAECPMLTDNATHAFTRRMSDDSVYGAYEIRFKSEEYFGTMPWFRGATRIYSKAQERGWICKPELEWLQERGVKYEILRGTEVWDENATDGWKELVLPIFGSKDGHEWTCPTLLDAGADCVCDPAERKKRKGQPVSLGAKVGVNSLYGVLIQLIERGGKWVPIENAVNPVDFAGVLALEKGAKVFEAGQFYAPVYSATLTSMVRVDLLKMARPVEADVVAFHTDSILLKDGARLPSGDKLGDWKIEKQLKQDEKLIILKSGQYAMGESVKGRGFSKRKLDPNNEDEIAKRHKADLWAPTHTRKSRVSVKTAKDWGRVSLIETRDDIRNNIAIELKRRWHNESMDARSIERMVLRGEYVDSDALENMPRSRPEVSGLE